MHTKKSPFLRCPICFEFKGKTGERGRNLVVSKDKRIDDHINEEVSRNFH